MKGKWIPKTKLSLKGSIVFTDLVMTECCSSFLSVLTHTRRKTKDLYMRSKDPHMREHLDGNFLFPPKNSKANPFLSMQCI